MARWEGHRSCSAGPTENTSTPNIRHHRGSGHGPRDERHPLTAMLLVVRPGRGWIGVRTGGRFLSGDQDLRDPHYRDLLIGSASSCRAVDLPQTCPGDSAVTQGDQTRWEPPQRRPPRINTDSGLALPAVRVGGQVQIYELGSMPPHIYIAPERLDRHADELPPVPVA